MYNRYNQSLTPFTLYFSAHLSPELRRTCLRLDQSSGYLTSVTAQRNVQA
jgi:hypothetical protein